MSNTTTDRLMAEGFNQTLLDKPYLCTTKTCPKELQTIRYIPSLGANAFFLALFTILLIFQIGFGFKWRTWSFAGCVFGGLVLEVVGYVGRIQIHNNPFDSDPFLMYLVTLTIAPCFLTAAIYLSLSRIIITYGTSLARFKPRTYTIIFICCDVFSLVLQAVGGAIADTADTKSLTDAGINIMIAGLVFQVVSLTLFAGLCAEFFWSVKKHGGVSRSVLQGRLPKSVGRLYLFIGSLSLATLCIYIRSIFRVAELQGGFDGHLANDEVTFIILESIMVGIASIALTLPHPGMIFGQNWKMAKARAAGEHGKAASSSPDISMERLREGPK
ncbi:phospholipid-translocating ATPase rsb1 [Xanthoria parietina]